MRIVVCRAGSCATRDDLGLIMNKTNQGSTRTGTRHLRVVEELVDEQGAAHLHKCQSQYNAHSLSNGRIVAVVSLRGIFDQVF